MKYMIYLLAATYIIGGSYVINVFFIDKKIYIENITQAIVVINPEDKLINYNDNPKGLFQKHIDSGMGAGFFIDNKGTIQTVNHILTKNNTVIYKGKKYIPKIITNDIKNDLAILKINIIENKYLNFGIINENKNIISFGINSKTNDIIYNTGTIINKKSKLDNMTNLLEISNNIKPGFSGGPIINQNGKVIGVNYAISEGKKYGIKF